MDDQHLHGNSPKDSFDEAVKILGGAEGFGGALWDAEMNAAFDAKQKIQATDPSQKYSVFQECMHSLRESLVAQAERWAPKYVDLAAAYPQFTNSDSISWTREQMQEVINKRLRAPNLDGAVAFVFMTMCGTNVEEKHTWSPPEWMCRSIADGVRRQRQLSSLIRLEHSGIVHRLQHALKKALADLRFSQVLKQGFAESPTPSHAEGGAQSKDWNAREAFVRPLLIEKGWSVPDWANWSKVDFHTADNYLKGKTNPVSFTRKKLADSLEVKVQDLPA